MTTSIPHEFDRRAAQYEQNADVQREAAAWLAEWLPDQIDHPALEVGAGTGLFTRHLAERAGKLVASDLAPRMVEAGRQFVPEAAWIVADAATPPDGGYGWIFSCSLVQWLADPATAFRAWHRVSAPGARLLAGWFVRGTLPELMAACPEAAPFVWRDADEWDALLGQAGWRVARTEVRRLVRHYPDSTAMLRSIHAVGATVPRRLGTGELRGALRRYDRDHRSRDGVSATFEFLRLEALRS